MKRIVLPETRFVPLWTRRPRTISLLDRLLKVAIVVTFGWVVYQQRIKEQDLYAMFFHFRAQLALEDLVWLVFTLLLMPLNWWLESLKWQCFTRTFAERSHWQHFRAVLAGVTFSLLTPNRLGDYLGRVLASGPHHRKKVFTATLAAHYTQLLVVLVLGWIGALFFLPLLKDFPLRPVYWAAFIGILGTLAMGWLAIYLPQLLSFVKRCSWIQRLPFVQHSLDVLQMYRLRHFSRATAFAVLRYGVYCTQYYCMLRLTGIDLNLGTAWSGIALIFLIQTSIPLPPALSLLARGEIALFVWGVFDANEWSILTASYGLFLINLLIPGIGGLVSVVRLNLIKPKKMTTNLLQISLVGWMLATITNLPVPGNPQLDNPSEDSFVDEYCAIDNFAFQAGESLTYKMYYNWKFVWVSAGEVTFKVEETDGQYHVSAIGSTYKSYDSFFKVRDKYHSWLDKETLLPSASLRDVEEGPYRLYDKVTFNRKQNVASSIRGKSKETAQRKEYPVENCIHDILSIIYFTRNLDFNQMKEGEAFPIKIFIDKKTWPLRVVYHGKDKKKRIRGQGKFDAMLFSPEVIAGNVFNEGAQVKVWVTDDKNRIPLQVESPLTVGSVKAVLQDYQGLKHEMTAAY